MKSSANRKIQNCLSLIFYILFSIMLLNMIINLIFNNTDYKWPTFYIIPIMLLTLTVFYYGFKLLKKYEGFLKRYFYLILIIFTVLTLIVRIIFCFVLEFKPLWDVSAVFDGAIEWATTGSFPSQYEYMYFYPNNLGCMAYFKTLFSAAKIFGITNYFAVASITNSVMTALMICAVSLTLKHISGYPQAVFSLGLFALSLPFYFIGAAIYTDAMSLLFPALSYYIYILGRKSDSTKMRVIYAVLFGLTVALGMLIKFTVLIAPVAIAIECLLRFDFKKTTPLSFLKKCALPVCSAVLLILLIPVLFNINIYSHHLERSEAEIRNTPVIHWVMMGLTGSGRSNDNENQFTRSFDSPEERDKQIKERIMQRIKDKGAVGMAQHLTNKSVSCFGDGTYALSDFLDDRPKHNTVFHKFLLYKGEHYKAYGFLCAGILYSIFVLALFSGLKYLFSKKYNKDITSTLTPHLAFFGIWLFLIFWEASGRYFTNFVPLIIICAALGTEYFTSVVTSLYKRLQSSFKNI